MNSTTTLDKELLEAIIEDKSPDLSNFSRIRIENLLKVFIYSNSEIQDIVKAYLENTEPNISKTKPVPVSKAKYVRLANQVKDIEEAV